MENQLIFFVNGRKITESHPDPRGDLLTYLRRTRLTGSKESCGEGRCGACTVMLSRYDRREKLVRHFSVNACLVPVCSLHNMAVTTVEGVGDTRRGLHKIQASLASAHGVQCGFCTPGMVMSMYSLLRNMSSPTQEDILRGIEGNLCRCTGYRSILDGFTKAAKSSCCGGDGTGCPCKTQNTSEQDSEAKCSFAPADPTQDVIFPPELKLHEETDRSLIFEHDGVKWIRPRDLAHLLLLLAENPKARIISGGTTVVLDMKLHGVKPDVLVSTNHIPELTQLEVKGDNLVVGAGLTLEELRSRIPLLIKDLPEWKARSLTALNKALSLVAASQIRNIASVAGNLLNSATVSDLQPLFLAMDADLYLDSAVIGSRTIPYRETMRSFPPNKALQPADVLIYVTLPLTKQNDHVTFFKHTERKGFNTSYVNAVPYVSMDPNTNVINDFHVTFGGKCFQPLVNFHDLNTVVKGKKWSIKLIPEVLSFMDKRLESSSTDSDPKHLAKVDIFKFFHFVEETMAGKTDASVLSALTKEEYKNTRVYQDNTGGQAKDDPLRKPIPQHSSDYLTTGEANFLDDVGTSEDELYAGLVLSKRPHARILKVDASPATSLPGVVGYVNHEDVPGKNVWGCSIQGERVFADTEVGWYGQIIGMVLAKDRQLAKKGAKKVVVEYEDLPVVYTIEEAISQGSFYTEESAKPAIVKGDVEAGFLASDEIIEGSHILEPREHYYMETHGVLVKPLVEQNQIDVYCTSQNPSQTQSTVASLLGLGKTRVTCHVKRLGGGFGGKETRNDFLTQSVAVAAWKYKRPVRCILPRRTDMTVSGKGPGLCIKYKMGVTKDGVIQSVQQDIYLDGGYNADISYAVLQQCVMNIDASYRFPACRITGYLCKTNAPPNTALRGFGLNDMSLTAEVMLDEAASKLNMTQTKIREVNMFREGDITVATMVLKDCMLGRCWQQCLDQSQFQVRRSKVEEFNRTNRWKKRGISIIPMKFGIGYREKYLCQGGALVQVYNDGTVLVAHGGTEMGQGLYIKMIQVTAHVLGIPSSDIHIAETATNTVPNTSSTAASVSSDLNGMAIKAACEEIKRRLEPLKEKYPGKSWKQLVLEAYRELINLSAVGHYGSRPERSFEFDDCKGKPADYTTYGAGCSEIEVDCLTGECQIIQTDLVIDVGRSLNPAIDLGQIEGAFQMGVGQMLMERAVLSEDGIMAKGGPSTYNIPTVRDIPNKLNVSLLKDSENPHGIFSSKGIGEPAICVAGTIYLALKNAIKDCRRQAGLDAKFDLKVPATPGRIREACMDAIQKLIIE